MIRTATLTAAVALMTTSAVACGGDTATAGDVKTAATAMFKGVATGDGKSVCARMLPDVRREFTADVRDLVLGDFSSCEHAVTIFSEGFTEGERAAFAEVRVRQVELDGDRALVHDEDVEVPRVLDEHVDRNGEPMVLTRERGRWLIAELG